MIYPIRSHHSDRLVKVWPGYLLTLIAAIFFFNSSQVFAQVSTGAIRGTVRDAAGGALSGVTVTVTNEATGVSQSTVTNNEGIYAFPILNVGTYTTTAEQSGFKKAAHKGIELQLNQTARIDFNLEVGQITDEVVIQAGVPLIENETSSLGRVVSERDVVDLPLNQRNFVQLAVLLPGSNFGAAGTIGGGGRPDDPRPRSSIFVNGTRDSSNSYLIDGIDNYDRIHTTIAVKPSIDAIKEFKVQTSLYSAEFGRNAGGVINVSVKSGTNEFHGTAYEFHRNKALDAKNFFALPEQPKPHFLLNQFGGTLGGPIVRDRTFFFGSFEGYRLRKGETFVSTVPTEAMRRGDFSGLSPIFDPLTTRPNPSGSGFIRDQFPGNIIPQNRMDGAAVKLIQLYPLPNASGIVNNFVLNPVREQNTDQLDFRVDHSFGARANLFVRYSFGDTDTITPAPLPGKAQGGAPFNFAGPNKLRTQGVSIGSSYTITPTLVNELRLGYTRIRSNVLPFFFGENISQKMGIPGANLDRGSSGLSAILITGFTGLGNSLFLPILKFLNNYQVTDNLNYIHGRHILKFGVHFLRPQTNHFQSIAPAGRFSFSPVFTNNPAAPGGTGNAMATFLLGYPSLTQRSAQLSPTYMRYIEHASYVQDDWKIHPRLTLNLGLRYELITPAVTVNDHLSNFDFQTGKVVISGVNTSRTAGIKTDKNNFAPRFGFAFTATPRTVLRGGYGVFYDTVPMFAQLRPFPFLITFTRSTGSFFVENRLSEGFPPTDFDIARNAANPFGQIDAVPFDNPLAYIQQFNLNLQRSLGSDIVLSVAYVGTLGRKLRWVYDENVPPPGPGPVQQRRPFFNVVPNVVTLLVNHPEASSTYHSLQISAEKRFARGLAFLGSYTWSHWIDNATSEAGYGAQGPNPQDIRNRRAERGNSPADLRHRLVLSWIYELPFGEGKRWGSSDLVVAKILGGWQVNGIATLQSGLPFTPVLAAATTNTGTGSRPDRIGNGALPRSERTLIRFFDTSAFTTPAQFTYGNAGRDILIGPGFVNFDFSLFKNFRLTETRTLQFRSEFFNLFNTPQFGLPNATFGTSGFGRISLLAGEMRQIQFSLKFVF